MIRGQPLTAIVPARGGSKGIPGKNLREIGGMPLLERAIRLGQASPWVDRVIVSTDDPKMHAIAGRLGAASPTLRPAHLATDDARAVDVVEHVIAECGITSGYLLLLQPTAPLRTLADLNGLCRAFEPSQADAAVSVAKHEEPRPEKLRKIDDGWLKPYLGEGFEGPRQALPQPYALNGAFYLIGREAFLAARKFIVSKTLAYVMPPERSHNLDSATDWLMLEAMVNAGHWHLEDYAR
jgi:CMP-N,N'-diacetyllegionaminic acid synthase